MITRFTRRNFNAGRSLFLSSSILIIFIGKTFSQAPSKEWDATFGTSLYDVATAVHQTPDGGYILVVIKVSQARDLMKQIATEKNNGMPPFGGSGQDHCESVAQTMDGGYILGGTFYSDISGDVSQESRGESDYWIVKINASGVKQWDARFGGSSYEDSYIVAQTSDGGYIVSGESYSGISGDKSEESRGASDYWIVKTDADGVKEWDATFGGNKDEEGAKTRQTPDGGYIIAGYSASGISGDKTQPGWGGDDFWIVKTDANGVKQWDARYGGNDYEYLGDIQLTNDGGYIMGGSSYSGISGDKTQNNYEFDEDFWVIKTDANGIKEWDATLGGNDIDVLRSLQQTTDNGYILGGESWSDLGYDKSEPNQGSADFWVVKIESADVSAVCDAPIGTNTSNISATSAHVFNWNGASGAIGYKVRYKVAGTSEWTKVQSIDNNKTLKDLSQNTEYAWQVKSICGIYPIISSDWSEKQFFTTNSLKSGGEIDAATLEVYPNPFTSNSAIKFSIPNSSNIKLDLLDLMGRKIKTVAEGNFLAGNYDLNFYAEDLSMGIYFLQLQTDSGILTIKLIIQ